MAKRRAKLGVVEALHQTRMMLAGKPKDEVPPDVAERRSLGLMSRAAINVRAKAVPDVDRIAESVMLDTILREYWRMKRPNKAALLHEYRRRCATTLPDCWIDHHCQMAAFLESILPEQDTKEMP